MKNKMFKSLLVSIIIVTLVFISGCIDLNTFFGGSDSEDNDVTYVKFPTKISYYVSYGYTITVAGDGDYRIRYDCNKPGVLNGDVTLDTIYDINYEDKTIVTFNDVLRWDINNSVPDFYELGLKALVVSESYMISDLNGTGSLTINQIKNQYPDYVEQYTKIQANKTTVFIDPDDPEIKEESSKIVKQTGSSNAFQIAKNLFIWLKQNTQYARHTGNNNVQTCYQTLDKETGDCDDLSFLYITLCRSADIPARFIRGFLVNYDNGIASLEPHAWAEVFVGGGIGKNGWIPVECASDSGDMTLQVNQNFGVESAAHLRLFKDDGSNQSLNTSLTGIRIGFSEGLQIQQSSFGDVNSYQILESKSLCIKDNVRTYKN